MAGRPIELGPTGEAVAANVKRLREAQNLTWTRTAVALTEAGRETSPLAVRRVEEGRRRVDADDLAALAAVLNVSPATLLMPQASAPDEPAGITGVVPAPSARRAWDWLTGRSPVVDEPARSPWFYMHGSPVWSLRSEAHPAVQAARQLLEAADEAVQIVATLDSATLADETAAEARTLRRRVASRLRRGAEQTTSQVGYLADDVEPPGEDG